MSKTVVSRALRAEGLDQDYFELIKRLPLRPLRRAREFSAAAAILDELVGRDDLSEGQRDYLDALVRFVEDYEKERLRDKLRKLRPLELLRHLMEENGMSTADLGHVLGSRGLASEVLNRKRGLSKRLIGRLAARFGVDPALFLESDEGRLLRSPRG
jgi:HTH-type transcriptional regulator/antitoxin HigA